MPMKGNVHNIGQMIEFICVVQKALAKILGKISPDVLQGWIGNSAAVEKGFEQLFVPPNINGGKFGRLTAVRVHGEGEDLLEGGEYMKRGFKVGGDLANQEAYDFFAKHTHLLPEKDEKGDEIERLVFIGTQFVGGHGFDFLYVRTMYLGEDSIWQEGVICWENEKISRRFHVAYFAE